MGAWYAIMPRLTFGVNVVEGRLASRVALRYGVRCIAPGIRNNFVLRTVRFTFCEFLVYRPGASYRIIIRFIFKGSMPIRKATCLFCQTIIEARRMRRSVLFLCSRRLTKRFGGLRVIMCEYIIWVFGQGKGSGVLGRGR